MRQLFYLKIREIRLARPPIHEEHSWRRRRAPQALSRVKLELYHHQIWVWTLCPATRVVMIIKKKFLIKVQNL